MTHSNGSNSSTSDAKGKVLSSRKIVSIAAAGLALLVTIVLLGRRRRQKAQDGIVKTMPGYPVVDIEGDESINTEGTPPYHCKRGSGSVFIDDAMVDTGSFKDSTDAMSTSSSDARDVQVAHADTVTAAGIALLLKDATSDLSHGTKMLPTTPGSDAGRRVPIYGFINQLEAAVD